MTVKMEESKLNSAANCTQCDRPAIYHLHGHSLCVDHFLKLQQAIYLQQSGLISMLNMVRDDLTLSTGIPHSRVELPRPPFIGDALTLNNINVSGSNIAAINTGTIRNLDASITIMDSQGKSDLAQAVKELTQAIIDSNEIDESIKSDIAQQLEFLTSQATAKAESRSLGVIKSTLVGLKSIISVSANLLAIWDKVEPLFRATFGL